jgi:hypothetical protein
MAPREPRGAFERAGSCSQIIRYVYLALLKVNRLNFVRDLAT